MELYSTQVLADRYAVSIRFIRSEVAKGYLRPCATTPSRFNSAEVAAWSFNRSNAIQLASEAEEWSWACGTQATLLDIPVLDADAHGYLYGARKLVELVDAILESQPKSIDFEGLIAACNAKGTTLRKFLIPHNPLAPATREALDKCTADLHEARMALGRLRRQRFSTAPDDNKKS